MDIYNIFLVLIWIPIIFLSKKKVLKFFKFDYNNSENSENYEYNELLKDIKKEYSDIKMVFNTEILSIKDEINYKKLNFIKEDIINEDKQDPKKYWESFSSNFDMRKVFSKSFTILKELFSHIYQKIKNFIF